MASLTLFSQVIQKLIERVTPDLLGFVTAFQGNVYDLATHPYGCRVLQRCFEYLHEPQTRPLIEELHKYTTQLMQDQFGVSRPVRFSYHGLTFRPELCDSVRPRTWGASGSGVDFA